MLFLGTHTPKLDAKGRMFLPAKFRGKLEDGLVITRGQDRSLVIYPQAEFERLVAQWQQTPTSNKAVRDYQRVFLSGASDERPDSQGRLTIPQVLRDYAGLRTECTVIGAGERVEVWDTERWTTYLAASEAAFAEQSEEVVPGLM
ncbi:division/cell wall cluster transcriptional repressor MraZ [Ornithinimicrobium avium]|uniref:Transcriptional regulator MraZ n=1 Tax=Ornithinimicrobium avium TaxID=2283195 RepID=A0A345NKV7_9MICO|nr:division/cell wall cluster transcriptional repressor MraZ [Ornithinimicrobium avium]AXH95665.1 transcriptional regulator MraZ [Ornithinimicrobium avium]